MSRRLIMPALALSATLWGTAAFAEAVPIGVIKGPSFDEAKAQAKAWLVQSQADAAKLARFEELWNGKEDRVLLDRVAETLNLGDADAAKLIAAGRDANTPAPTAVPEFLKDTKKPVFFRANLGLYYAKQLSQRRVHEEALEVLRTIRPEHVVDPASYYFFKAAAEHKLQLKEDGLASTHRLLNSVPDAPERYLVVAELMQHEMQQWKDKDLGHIARLMDIIERRLDLARGGPKTQEKQKEVIAMLDKMIEDLEKQCGT